MPDERIAEIPPFRPGDTITLGLDPSMTSTGFSVFRGTNLIKAGHFTTSPGDPEPLRVWDVFREVSLLINECGVEQVAMEQFTAFYTSSKGGAQFSGLPPAVAAKPGKARKGRHDRTQANPRSMFLMKAAQTAAQAAVLAAGVPLFLYKVSEWKGGRGIGKKQIVERAHAFYGVKTRNDNVCDAIMIGHHHIYQGRLFPDRGVLISPASREGLLAQRAE